MGLKSNENGLVPCRFLCIIAHLVILISMFIRRGEYVVKCTEYSSSNTVDNQFIAALSLSIGFIVIELASFMSGLTLFNSFQLTFSTLFHSTAAIALSCMIIYEWCSIQFWIVFAICSCVPLAIELTFLFSICYFKRTVN